MSDVRHSHPPCSRESYRDRGGADFLSKFARRFGPRDARQKWVEGDREKISGDRSFMYP
jgi:hypothetical protein